MAAPTLVSSTLADATTSVTSNTSASITYNAGDLLVVVYGNEGGGSGTDSISSSAGLTWTQRAIHNGAGANCDGVIWTAQPTAAGSTTVTCTNTVSEAQVFVVYLFRNHGGVGANNATAGSGDTSSITTTGADSAVCWGLFDWNAAAAPTTLQPAGSTSAINNALAAHYTRTVAVTGDVVTAGATTYGGNASSTTVTKVAVEVKAAAGGTPVTVTGVTATATSATPAGSVSTGVTVAGPVATSSSAAPAGSVTASRSVTLAGPVATSTSVAPTGSVSVGGSVNIAGPTATATSTAPAGSVSALRSVTVAGPVATGTSTALAGSVSTGVNLAGPTATAASAAPAGAVSVGGAVTVAGPAAHSTSAAPAGVVTATRSATVAGLTATATAQALAGLISTGLAVPGAVASSVSRALVGSVTAGGPSSPITVVKLREAIGAAHPLGSTSGVDGGTEADSSGNLTGKDS